MSIRNKVGKSNVVPEMSKYDFIAMEVPKNDQKHNGIIKGVGGGLAAGMAVGFIGGQMMKNSKQMKKKAGKAMHAVGDLFENVQYMFK